jgi:hypothetical protein
VQEPGIDEHGWASRYEALEPELHDAPAESLADLDELIAEMMEARGLPLQEREGEQTDEPETVRQFEEARRVTRLLETGDPYDPGDIANAIDGYRSLYDHLLGLGPTAGSPT